MCNNPVARWEKSHKHIWEGECANMGKNPVTRCEKSYKNIWEGECDNMGMNPVTRFGKLHKHIWEEERANMGKIPITRCEKPVSVGYTRCDRNHGPGEIAEMPLCATCHMGTEGPFNALLRDPSVAPKIDCVCQRNYTKTPG